MARVVSWTVDWVPFLQSRLATIEHPDQPRSPANAVFGLSTVKPSCREVDSMGFQVSNWFPRPHFSKNHSNALFRLAFFSLCRILCRPPVALVRTLSVSFSKRCSFLDNFIEQVVVIKLTQKENCTAIERVTQLHFGLACFSFAPLPAQERKRSESPGDYGASHQAFKKCIFSRRATAKN